MGHKATKSSKTGASQGKVGHIVGEFNLPARPAPEVIDIEDSEEENKNERAQNSDDNSIQALKSKIKQRRGNSNRRSPSWCPPSSLLPASSTRQGKPHARQDSSHSERESDGQHKTTAQLPLVDTSLGLTF
jgi:hypothetical protein